MPSQASTAVHQPRAVRLPPPLTRGAAVGIAALSGVVDGDRLCRGVEALRELGFEPVEAENLHCRAGGMFAGNDRQRVEGFHRLAADPEIAAIVFARGGHGVLRLLPEIDWSLLARNPRAYVGYSDLTPVLNQVVSELGLVAFHGPMVAADLARGLNRAERRSFSAALEGRFPAKWKLRGGLGETPVEGRLMGGCLSLLASTQGTPWALDPGPAVLFLEDVGEPLYRLDRMLTHLRLSGTLDEICGIVFGHFTSARQADENVAGETSSDDEVAPGIPVAWLTELAEKLRIPIAWGIDAGHEAPNLTLPLGLDVRLDPAQLQLAVIA